DRTHPRPAPGRYGDGGRVEEPSADTGGLFRIVDSPGGRPYHRADRRPGSTAPAVAVHRRPDAGEEAPRGAGRRLVVPGARRHDAPPADRGLPGARLPRHRARGPGGLAADPRAWADDRLGPRARVADRRAQSPGAPRPARARD